MITIDKALCNNCNTCVKVCPVGALVAGENPSMPRPNKLRCVSCGHCEAVCPQSALTFNYPQSATEPLATGKSNISAEELGLYMRNRRSIRQYRAKQVDRNTIEQLMDVVRYAPTGINRQSVSWTIIYDTKKVKELTALTVDGMREMMKDEAYKKSVIPFEKLVTDYDKGIDSICRNAPHLFIAHTLADYPIGATDAAIALTHLELALPAYGMGGCWAGYINIALRLSADLRKAAGLPENQINQGILLAGYPTFTYKKIPKRNAVNINWQ